MKVVLGLIVWFALFMGASKVFGQVVVNTGSKAPINVSQACLSGGLECDGMSLYVPSPVINNTGMQPFGLGAEDDYTASEALHQTGYYNPHITIHGSLIQGSK